MTPSLTRYAHIYRALARLSPDWAAAHRLRATPAGLLFQVHHGIIVRTLFAVVECDNMAVIVSGISDRPVAESTLLAWMKDPEGLRNFA